MKTKSVIQIAALCMVALISNRTFAVRNQWEYTGPLFHIRQFPLPDELIEWVARNLEDLPLEPYNSLQLIMIQLDDPRLTDEASRYILTQYGWGDFTGSIQHLRELMDGLTIADIRTRIGQGDKQACLTGNYRVLLNTIKWIYTLDGNILNGEFIPLNYIEPPEGYSKLIGLVKKTSQEIMTSCVEHIQEAYQNMSTQHVNVLDYMMTVYGRLAAEDMEKKLYEESVSIDSLDRNFVNTFVENAFESQPQQLEAQRRMLVKEYRRNLRNECKELLRDSDFALSIGIYELAKGMDPQLVEPLEDLASTWTFMKLREYNRLCTKYFIERRT